MTADITNKAFKLRSTPCASSVLFKPNILKIILTTTIMATLVAKNKRILSMVIPSSLMSDQYGDEFEKSNICQIKYLNKYYKDETA